MATFNSSPNILNTCIKTTEALQSSAAFFVPSPSPLLGLNTSSFAASASAIENHAYIGIQKDVPSLTHHVNSSSSYSFMEIKREPCQVSEVTTSNSLQSSNQHNSKSIQSTMTTMVKIESTSPKISEMEKVVSQMNTNNSVPIGIAVARKRPQETNVHTAPIQPPRDLNYFGIRVADIGGVATAGCGNIYFAGADLMSGATAEDMNTNIHNVNRSASTFWQYPNTFPIESVISMSPVGLQYSRDASRGQLVLLPATAAMDSFQQAAFLWPPYMQQNTSGALQTPPNFLFPSMGPQTNTQSQSFGAPLQLLGSNYLTAATATSTLCHHSQTNGNRFLPLSPDTKRIEQSQKHSAMKIEDWNSERNILNKSNLVSHHVTTGRVDKSKIDSESNYIEMQANTNLVGPMGAPLHEQSHIITHNTPSPPEFINIPSIPSNFISTKVSASLPSQITPEVIGGMYKNSALKIASFSKTPEMQDVNIQTDTPVCSEDENSSLEVSTAETMSCSISNYERNKPTTNLQSTQCHNNYGGFKAQLKENSSDTLQMHSANNDYSTENTQFAVPEPCQFENEFTSVNKKECFSFDSSAILPSADRGQMSPFKATDPPLSEMSGLELLSNISTGTFINNNSLKTVCVKEEPSEVLESEHKSESLNNYELYGTGRDNLNSQYSHPTDENEIQNTVHSAQSSEPALGGLNLLCALAEQRIQEEVESNNFNNSVKEQNPEVKRRKHKHSKTKSSRKSRYYKKNKKKYAKERKEYLKASGLKPDCEDVHENLKNAFKKVDSSYKKLNKWPNPEDFFKAMESDMRMRLADITRQYRKKKRKLDEISKIKKRKKGSSSDYKFANISCKNPNFICFLDKFQPTSSNFSPPAESNESHHITIHTKTSSEHVTEINECQEDTPLCEEVYSSKCKKRTSHNTILAEKLRCKESKGKRKQRHNLAVDKNEVGSRLLTSESQQADTIIKVEEKVAMEIDKELVLSNEHLYRKETRVLTDMGGLFYAGILKPLQPPDVYAITLDGERGNKSHIMSREEIFKDTILEVAPKTVESITPGTRLCAYWSQQYRCLYPGKAIDSELSDIGSDFVSVEFDDGDSGRIRLQNIRFLLSDYPIVEYSENPFNALGKNKKSTGLKSAPADKMSNESVREEMSGPFIQDSNQESYAHKIYKQKIQFDTNLSSTSNLSECVHKHRKHKKRKKHKKHHRKLSLKTSTTVTDTEQKEKQIQPIEEVESVNFSINEIKSDYHKKNDCKLEKLINGTSEEKSVHITPEKCVKSEAIGLDDEDSTSNVVSETSDEAKSDEKIDYNSGKGSKIAAFLPERQLWGWLGQAYRKAGLRGRARKQFYKSITRGKETITVGECAVFLSTGRPDRPYIGRIEAMWETTSSNKIVRVRWFYHPEETVGCPILKYPGALFDSPHEDENDVQTISHRCEVIEFSKYIAKFGLDTKKYQSIYDNNDTYYLSGYYNPRLQVLKLQPDIPTE